jgi:hypothetical protein
MQNVWVLTEGEPIETGKPWFSKDKITEGKILTPKEFIEGDYFILNQAFVQRRNPIIDPTVLYGKRYVDSVITYHHLQFGSVICTDSCDYIYMKHPGAITTSLTENDRTVMWCLGIYIPMLIPSLAGLFIRFNFKKIIQIVNMARQGEHISQKSFMSRKDLNVYIYKVFYKQKLSVYDRVKLYFIRLYLLVLIYFDIHFPFALRVLYLLLIHPKIDKNVNFNT